MLQKQFLNFRLQSDPTSSCEGLDDLYQTAPKRLS